MSCCCYFKSKKKLSKRLQEVMHEDTARKRREVMVYCHLLTSCLSARLRTLRVRWSFFGGWNKTKQKNPFVRNFSLPTSCFVSLERACHRVIKHYRSDLLPLNHNRINDVGHKGRAYPKDAVFVYLFFLKVKAVCTAPYLLHSQMKKRTCVCFQPLLLHEYL